MHLIGPVDNGFVVSWISGFVKEKLIPNHTVIACIGSRSLDTEDLAMCEWIGKQLAKSWCEVATGNAKGADQAFARGSNKVNEIRTILCLPWESFEHNAIKPGNLLWTAEKVHNPETHPCVKAAKEYSRNWDALPKPQQLLRIRNAMILHFAPVVLAWPGEGNGTKWTMGLAKKSGKRVIDLSDEDQLQSVIDFLKDPQNRRCI